jgi:fatty-acyl-CoA synthase
MGNSSSASSSFIEQGAVASTETQGIQEQSLDAYELLKYSAAKYGNRIALVQCGAEGSEVLRTYKQLHQGSMVLARRMAQLGVQRGTPIAVMLRNRYEVLEAHFAAAALHAVIVNVNVNLAAPEVAYILSNSAAEILLTDAEFQSVIEGALGEAEATAEKLPLESIMWAASSTSSSTPTSLPQISNINSVKYPLLECSDHMEPLPEHGGNDGDGFHMYYTSGTTGKPKAVVLSHRIVVLHALGTILGKLHHTMAPSM